MIIKDIPKSSLNNLRTRLEKAVNNENVLYQGKNWYSSANSKLTSIALEHNLSLPVVCGITSRLSPSISWARNIHATIALIEGKSSIDGYMRNVEIARKIFKGEFGTCDCGVSTSFPRSARKTFAFYHNLLHVDKSWHITVDRWMLRAALSEFHARKIPGEFQIHEKVYKQISTNIDTLSKEFELNPIQAQACIWLEIRQSWRKK